MNPELLNPVFTLITFSCLFKHSLFLNLHTTLNLQILKIKNLRRLLPKSPSVQKTATVLSAHALRMTQHILATTTVQALRTPSLPDMPASSPANTIRPASIGPGASQSQPDPVI